MTGALSTLPSSTIANGSPTLRPRDLGEALGADAVETERDDRLAGLLVEAGAGIGQPIALQHRLAFDRIRAAAATRQIS